MILVGYDAGAQPRRTVARRSGIVNGADVRSADLVFAFDRSGLRSLLPVLSALLTLGGSGPRPRPWLSLARWPLACPPSAPGRRASLRHPGRLQQRPPMRTTRNRSAAGPRPRPAEEIKP